MPSEDAAPPPPHSAAAASSPPRNDQQAATSSPSSSRSKTATNPWFDPKGSKPKQLPYIDQLCNVPQDFGILEDTRREEDVGLIDRPVFRLNPNVNKTPLDWAVDLLHDARQRQSEALARVAFDGQKPKFNWGVEFPVPARGVAGGGAQGDKTGYLSFFPKSSS